MAITIAPPAAMDTPLKKWRWALRWDENLRLAHNWMGEWFTQGKTVAQYNLVMGITNPASARNNMLTRRLRNVFPWKPQLSESEWNFFVMKHHQFVQRLHAIMHEMRPALPNQTDAERDALQVDVEAAKVDGTLDAHDGTLDEV